MYYITEHSYAGPNQLQEKFWDADYIVISTIPPRTNMSHEVRTEGWCGTTNDWGIYAHGEFESMEDAVEAINSRFNGSREIDDNDGVDDFAHHAKHNDDGWLVTFKPGRYEPISPETLTEWMDAYTVSELEAAKTQSEVEAFIEAVELEVNSDDCTLGEFGRNYIREMWDQSHATAIEQ